MSGRTIRRDVERLRGLGYPVESLTGPGRRLPAGAGTAMPPLLLDEEEAIAIAVGLRTAARASVTGIEETRSARWSSSSRCCRRTCAGGSPRWARPRSRSLPGPDRRPAGPHRDRRGLPRLRMPALPLPRRDGTRSRRTSSRTRSSTAGAAGTSSPGTAGARTGGRSASTGSPAAATGLRFTPRALPAEDAAAYVEQSIAGAFRGTRPASPSTLSAGEVQRRLRSWARSPRSTPGAASTAPPTTTSSGSPSASPCSASSLRSRAARVDCPDRLWRSASRRAPAASPTDTGRQPEGEGRAAAQARRVPACAAVRPTSGSGQEQRRRRAYRRPGLAAASWGSSIHASGRSGPA